MMSSAKDKKSEERQTSDVSLEQLDEDRPGVN